MGTKADVFRDCLIYTDDLTGMIAWFVTSGWSGWDSEGTTDLGATGSFADGVVASRMFLDGAANLAVGAVRLRKDCYDEFVALGPPGLFEFLAIKDPYAAVTYADPLNPTLAEAQTVRDVFYGLGAAAQVKIRTQHSALRTTYDELGAPNGTEPQDLRFISFGENWPEIFEA